MSIVSAPFLSLNASGQFAKTLVATTWKGKPVLRKYTVPTNPNTTAQQAHRLKMTNAVRIWRTYFTNADMRESYQTLATLKGLVMSGFNLFTSEVMPIYAATISLVATQTTKTAATLTFTTKNVVDGIAGTEGGTFDLWAGTSKNNLQLHSTVAIAAGNLVYDVHVLYPATTVLFCHIIKQATTSYRSGLWEIIIA